MIVSLINKMLKDLDQRTILSGNQNTEKNILSELKSPMLSSKRPLITLKWSLILLFILGFSTLFYLQIQKQMKIHKAMAAVNIAEKKMPMELATTEVNHDTNVEEITLNNFTLDSGANLTYLRFTLSKTTKYFVANNNSGQPILLTLTNTKLIPDLLNMVPELPTNNWIQKLKFEQLNGALVIEIVPMPNVELGKLETKNDQQGVQLSIQFINKTKQGADKTNDFGSGTMKKTMLPPTLEETAKKQYQQAMELTINNQIPEAITKLEKLLATDPAYTPARERLTTLLLKIGKNSQAAKVLADGLARDPENSLFIKIKAQMLANEKKFDAALKLLHQHNPAMDRDPNYYGFMALLYQHTGQYMLAAKTYSQLVKLQPYNSIWWVGLGTALEAADANNAAIEAYKNALRSENDLSPEVQAYVENKINQLS
jgi:tetratricopeptide (TPR) repeat protein